MNFEHLNFKLVVLNQLIDKGHFKEELKELKDKYWDSDNYEYEPIPQINDFCKNVVLTEELLAEITFIEFDGGLDIYHDLIPNWDGEDEQFDVDSLADVTKLPNLESISEISMLTATDIEPLLQLKNLKEVSWYALSKDEVNASRLRENGVVVTA